VASNDRLGARNFLISALRAVSLRWIDAFRGTHSLGSSEAAVVTTRLQPVITSLVRLTSRRAGSGSRITWRVAIWRALPTIQPPKAHDRAPVTRRHRHSPRRPARRPAPSRPETASSAARRSKRITPTTVSTTSASICSMSTQSPSLRRLSMKHKSRPPGRVGHDLRIQRTLCGPKRRRQVQAVISMASMHGTAVGRLSSCRHPAGALPWRSPITSAE
jgi:hypothetical protein